MAATAKYMWLKHMEIKTIKFTFKLEDHRNRGGEHVPLGCAEAMPTKQKMVSAKERVIQPDYVCFSFKYGPPGAQTPNDLKIMFYIGMKKIAELMKTTESSANFLNETLEHLVPGASADPCYFYGIDLLCAWSYDDVLRNERLQVVIKEPFLNEVGKSFSRFFKHVITQNKTDRPDHPVGYLIDALRDPNFQQDIEDLYKQHSENFVFQKLFLFIQMMVRDTQDTVDERISFLSNVDLQGLVQRMADLDGICTPCTWMALKQFHLMKHGESDGQRCFPDLLYSEVDMQSVIVNIREAVLSAEMKPTTRSSVSLDKGDMGNGSNDVDSSGEDDTLQLSFDSMTTQSESQHSVTIKICFLWQMFEHLFGRMMQREVKIEGKTVIMQAGILVRSKNIQTVVLAVDVDVYSSLKMKSNAAETIKYFSKLAKKKRMWCRLYLLKKTHGIHNLIKACKRAQTYFCTSY